MLKDDQTVAASPPDEPKAPAKELSAATIGKIEAQATAILDKAGVIAMVTGIESNDAPAWPGTYKVTLDRDLDSEPRRAVQKQLRGTGVAGVNWVFFKLAGIPAAKNGDRISDAAPAAEGDILRDKNNPKNADAKYAALMDENRALNRQIEELLGGTAAALPLAAQQFPSTPGYYWKDCSYESILNDEVKRGAKPIYFEFKGEDAPHLWVVFHKDPPTCPPDGTLKAAATAPAPVTAASGTQVRIVETVGEPFTLNMVGAALQARFRDLLASSPYIRAVHEQDTEEVIDIMNAHLMQRSRDRMAARQVPVRPAPLLIGGAE